MKSVPILFKSENYLVVDKPSGCLTVPSRYQEKDERPCLGLELQKEYDRLWPVHRLDFEVSGLVLFARNAKTHEVANSWFEKSKVRKTYEALSGLQNFSHWPEKVPAATEKIEGLTGARFEWNCRIEKGKRRSYESPRGKLARTEAEILESVGSYLHWHLFPLTGRSHQLRFEMSRHGFPILGDQLYGGIKTRSDYEIALRALRLDFSQIAESERRGLPKEISSPVKNYLQIKFLERES